MALSISNIVSVSKMGKNYYLQMFLECKYTIKEKR